MAYPYPYTAPIAPYNNLPIESQDYEPSRFVISAVTLGQTTTITTTTAMNYVVGQLVRLIIPPTFGCRQLNEQKGYVLSLPATTQVVVGINSAQNVDPYVASSATTKAQIIAVGDISNGQINSSGRVSNGTYIPGSFINIST